MAILWEQRKLVKALKEFDKAELLRQSSYGDRTHEQLVYETHAHPDGHASWENVIIREVLVKEGFTEDDRVQFTKWQDILNSCIRDGFIEAFPNENYNPTLLPKGNNVYAIYSKRRIKLSGNKGVELLNRRYFWLKYIPEAFPEPAKIVTSVIITVGTAIITTLLLWSGLSRSDQDHSLKEQEVRIILQTPEAPRPGKE